MRPSRYGELHASSEAQGTKTGDPTVARSPHQPLKHGVQLAGGMATECTAAHLTENILVVTMLSSGERNEQLSAMCRREGLRCVLGFGVDLNLIDLPRLQRESALASTSLPRHNATTSMFEVRDMTAGEYACAAAHRNTYDHILMNGLPCAIVLENDVYNGTLNPRATLLSTESLEPALICLDTA